MNLPDLRPALGTLLNRVEHSETAPRWTMGIWDLVRNLRARDLI